ncbi:hypothetical protein RJ640_005317 [Escallonia rubra]|uniref:TORTIFOLIA1/SINE1-2 N-terminal domain-containing protein n=1 Tax=Escallonia rubra TaxID=112253 RepID=A0AA88QHN6_9ASTE|nr:hypothetical protein RJ640_005317 [Escallonia rubra]
MAVTKQSSTTTTASRDFKHRVLTCLTKLSDRDTHSAAANELESIARTLTPDSVLPFLSSISATDATDKSPVRKQSLRLISLLSETHGDILAPHVSRLLSAVLRRLRDPDSAVRSACAAAVSSISSHVTKPPSTSILKPLTDALFTEQDKNAQTGAALCLAAAISASPDPDLNYLRRLVPRLEKLLKCEGFKAKPALLTVVGSVIGAGGACSEVVVRNLVGCLVGCVGSEDWAARKAAAEALWRLAVSEGDFLVEFKASCLKTFEAKRFDKVKCVRESMNQMVEAWKEIPDASDEVSMPPESQASRIEVASDGRYPPGSKTSYTASSGAPQIKRKHIANNGSPVTTARKSSPLDCTDMNKGPAMFRKLDHKKVGSWKVGIDASSVTVVSDGDVRDRYEKGLEECEERNRNAKPETRRVLFNKKSDEKVHNYGGSNVEETSLSIAVATNVTGDLSRNQKESEDLSLIRKQLVQIETQQSSLLDLLQSFIGSSQNGMHSLETRVHGLELALEEISYDLAASTGRMSNMESTGSMCCRIPGADFLSSKLWRRAEGRYSTSRFSSSGGTPSVAAMHHMVDKNRNAEAFKGENRRFPHHAAGGFIVNPLAEVRSDSLGISEVSSKRGPRDIHHAV